MAKTSMAKKAAATHGTQIKITVKSGAIVATYECAAIGTKTLSLCYHKAGATDAKYVVSTEASALAFGGSPTCVGKKATKADLVAVPIVALNADAILKNPATYWLPDECTLGTLVTIKVASGAITSQTQSCAAVKNTAKSLCYKSTGTTDKYVLSSAALAFRAATTTCAGGWAVATKANLVTTKGMKAATAAAIIAAGDATYWLADECSTKSSKSSMK